MPAYEDPDDISDFQSGAAISQENLPFRDEYEDKFRLMLEKSDLVGGIVAVHEWNDSFAGVAARTLETFKQEVPKCPVLAFAPINPFLKRTKWADEPWADLNMLLGFRNIILPWEDLTIPMELPPQMFEKRKELLSGFRPELRYHVGAVAALGIDSAVHLLARKSADMDMNKFVAYFACDQNAKMAHMRQSMPFVRGPDQKIVKAIEEIKAEQLDFFTPEVSKAKRQAYVSHNILRANSEEKALKQDMGELLDKVPRLSKYVRSSFFDENILLPLSYPRFFGNRMGTTGQVSATPLVGPGFVTQIPHYENIYLTYKTGSYLRKKVIAVRERQVWLKNLMAKGKLDVDEWDEISSDMAHVVDAYSSLK
ncbi:MAG: hypothetical protein P4M11_08215 [Candidatus Pacebacteria bacterium]|nr:hypothetical protein [Candidatus Paceibacterota bacterium]